MTGQNIVEVIAVFLITASIVILGMIATQSIFRKRLETKVNTFLADLDKFIPDNVVLYPDKRKRFSQWVLETNDIYIWGGYNFTHRSDTISICVAANKVDFIASLYCELSSCEAEQVVMGSVDMIRGGHYLGTQRIRVILNWNLRNSLIQKIKELNNQTI